MSIGNPAAFILLLAIIPIFVIYFIIYKYGVKDLRVISHGLASKKLSDHYFKKFFFSALFFSLAVIFLILTLADFKLKKEYETENFTAVDIVFLIDISNSMLANVLLPTRLDRVKHVVVSLLENKSETRFSVVAFKGSAIAFVPMTEDYLGIRSGVYSLTPALLTTPGTDISAGIIKAINSFPTGKESKRVIFLFSDGDAGDFPNMKAIELELQSKRVKLFSIGCGTKNGGEIFIDDSRILLDNDGQPVKAPLQDDVLIKISEFSGGSYFNIKHSGIIQKLDNVINNEIKNIGIINHSVVYPSQYMFFLILAFISILMYMFIRFKK